ncbi:MAG: succinate dehydrogenase [Acidobacteriota bacterium]|nr:MAG: succinate dehydrogenase [Acidobacteriota bacterium]
MTSKSFSLSPRRSFGETLRKEAWWIYPLFVFLGLGAFVVYSTWAAFQAEHYRFGPYLSPFYSPELLGSEHAWFGAKPAWIPDWLPFSPAFLILWAPAGFRLTCYYYRGAYYKAFWADPPSCAVGEPRSSYRGERKFPLILQNVHRYFLYLALVFLIFLLHDVWEALWFVNPSTGGTEFGIGVGTIILAANVFFLGGYTLGCHSLRHLIGGSVDEISKFKLRWDGYRCVTCLNNRHMVWAWCSLFVVGFSDVYVRLCSMGIWTDWRIL